MLESSDGLSIIKEFEHLDKVLNRQISLDDESVILQMENEFH